MRAGYAGPAFAADRAIRAYPACYGYDLLRLRRRLAARAVVRESVGLTAEQVEDDVIDVVGILDEDIDNGDEAPGKRPRAAEQHRVNR